MFAGMNNAQLSAGQRPAWRKARGWLAMGLGMALAACTVIPRPAGDNHPAPPPPVNVPLPSDEGARHRVALLVPLSGANGLAGQALANAANMALLDTNATNLRITTYDTAQGAPSAAARAVADGNRLILGPLLGEDALAVAQTARSARVPVISYSSDENVAGDNVFVMGAIPEQSVAREVRYARGIGVQRFAALIPLGDYGERVGKALIAEVKASGGSLVGMESYDRTSGAVANAVKRLKMRGPFEAVLIADTATIGARAAALLKPGRPGLHILGTELWAGEAVVAQNPALNGAIYAALPDARFSRFSSSYQQRFGNAPYRVATLGYDSVLLTLRVAREWPMSAPFPTQRLYDRGGFLGLDGIFRFSADDVIERSLEVREARGGVISVISPAPSRFED